MKASSLSNSIADTTLDLAERCRVPHVPRDRQRFNDRIYWFSRARQAWSWLLRVLPCEHVLLPAYVGSSIRDGSGVMDPILEHGCSFQFYLLGHKLQIDLQHFEDCLRSRPTDIVLVIHYFGFVQPNMPQVRALCDKYEVLLVEDCCHCLPVGTLDQATDGCGTWGECAFYAVHKWIPAADGAFLRIRERLATRGFDRRESGTCVTDSESVGQHISTRYRDIAAWRRHNYELLASLLEPLAERVIPLHPQLAPETVPMNFPLLLTDQDRHQVFQSLIEDGIRSVALYYQLVPQISAAEFPVSTGISRRILNLPIHQDVSVDDVRRMPAALARAIGRREEIKAR